jgi:hypothetical protein
MPFRDDLWTKPVVNGVLAGVIIKTSHALSAVAMALEKIQRGDKNVAAEIELVRQKSDELTVIFDELTGWTDDDG